MTASFALVPKVPLRQRRRRNGRLEIIKRPSAAANARPKKIFVTHGGSSALLRGGTLDLRSRVGRAYARYKEALIAHLGEPSAPEVVLVDQCARLQLLCNLAWAELHRRSAFDKAGALAPAFDALMRASRELRECLRLLGLERRQADVLDIAAEVAKQRREEEARAPA
jgi:hypothetical protein